MRIGVLTSGGDAPGMNAAIRAVVRSTIFHGGEALGIRRGYEGLLDADAVPLAARSVGDIIHRGGTILRTARSDRFLTPDGVRLGVERLRAMRLDGLVVIGGDGSMRGALALAQAGVAVVGIPGSIDNDIYGTEYSLGFDTAVNTVVEAINRLRDTASAYGRAFVVEVMGRDAGFIALAAGVAGGAEHILVPEVPTDLDGVADRVGQSLAAGKSHSIIVVAEGASSGQAVGHRIEARTGLVARVTVLGYLQRGGTPTAFDRLLASRMGGQAVAWLREGRHGVMAGADGPSLVPVPLAEVATRRKALDLKLLELARELAI